MSTAQHEAAAQQEQSAAAEHGGQYDPGADQNPEMPYCPLTLKNVHATVSSTGDGFAVEVTADDAATAEQIWNRIQALAPGHSG